MRQNLLLVDDDADALLTLTKALSLKLKNVNCHAASNVIKALELAKEIKPQVIIQDLSIDPKIGVTSGFDLLKALVEHDPSARIIMLTGHSDKANGIKAIELGAASFMSKPADLDHLLALCIDAFNQAELRRELFELKSNQVNFVLNDLLGDSPQTQELKKSIQYVAATNQPLLINGETGTGKGLCALLIHKLSKRAARKFVRYQPNFTAAEMVNSDLFGHTKGAFTGAESNRSGLLTEADGGTLFLDEIDELPLQTQVSLLGVLQDKTFRALGSNQESHSDFRLICACNKPIPESLSKGLIREDFYHRIAHFSINIAPLRERKEDIAPLALGFLKSCAEQEQLSVFSINSAALELLNNYSWPGNIRELKAKIESAVYKAAFNNATEIEPQHLMLDGIVTESSSVNMYFSNSSELNYVENVKVYKKALVEEALKKSNGNQIQAARMLGVNRSTLKRALEGVE